MIRIILFLLLIALAAAGAAEFGGHSALYVQTLIIVTIGGGIGLTVARWLSSAAD